MKPKTHIRIVCLKNDSKDRRHQQHHSLIVSNQSSSRIAQEQIIAPNLVHLSARLQEQSRQDNRNSNYHVQAINANLQLSHPPINQKLSQMALQQDLSPMNVEKYFQSQKIGIDKERSTIKNMMGSIDFSADRQRQKKLARILKQTIKKGSESQRFNRKKIKEQAAIKMSSSQNRPLLQQDFKTFLSDKEALYKCSNVPRIEEDQNYKLGKLSMINPQKQPYHKYTQQDNRSLNLFHFLSKKNPQKHSNPRLPSSLRLEPVSNISNISNIRLQKKIFKMTLNLKTQQKEFDWSRMPSSKPYEFCTIDS